MLARYATNRRLGNALHLQAFSALIASRGTRLLTRYAPRKIGHHAALRQLANRLVGILHGCLKTGTKYDEHAAWQHNVAAASRHETTWDVLQQPSALSRASRAARA